MLLETDINKLFLIYAYSFMESMQGKRRYVVCDSFFDTWSDVSAYVLGFLTADGSVYGRTVSVDLAEKDFIIVEFVRDCLCPGKPIEIRKKNGSIRIRANSVTLCKKLESLGVFPQKTGKEFLPDIPLVFLGSYIRGIFDGDGWVYTRRNSIECGIVSASKDLLLSMRNHLNNIGQIRLKKKNKNSKNLWQWDMYASHAEMFRDYIYKNAYFFLPRKFDKFYSEYKVPSKNKWTDQQITKLLNNYVVGGDLKKLSEKIGRSYKAVSKKIWELDLVLQKVAKELL
jgi:hypothetical protein